VKAVVFIGSSDPLLQDIRGELPHTYRILGVSLLNRLIRILRMTGVKDIYLINMDGGPRDTRDILRGVAEDYDGIVVLITPYQVLYPSTLRRLIDMHSGGGKIYFLGRDTRLFIAICEASLLRDLSLMLGDDDRLIDVMERAIRENYLEEVYLDDLGLGGEFIPVLSEVDVSRAEKYLLDRIQKRRHFAAYYNALIENFFTRLLSRFDHVTPNRVTIIVNLLAYLVAYLFYIGYRHIAVILMFIVSALDGVDGKIARVKHLESKTGAMEHVYDFLWETAWILVYIHYVYLDHGVLALFTGLTILVLDFFNRYILVHFERIIGDLRAQSRFDRVFCLFDARRNTYLWYMLVGVFLDLKLLMLYAILIHIIITTIIYIIRTMHHTLKVDKAIKHSQITLHRAD